MSNEPYCVWCNRIGHGPTEECQRKSAQRKSAMTNNPNQHAAKIAKALSTQPTRDGAEGAINDIPPDAEHPINYRKAFAKSASPKPAPDAVRDGTAIHYLSAVRLRLEQLYELKPDDSRLREQISDETDWLDEQIKHASAAPVPSPDGPITTEQLDRLQFGRSLHARPLPAVAAEPETAALISRCYEHGQPDYVLAADRLKGLLAAIQAAYSLLWRDLGPPTTYAKEARKILREQLSHEQTRAAISWVKEKHPVADSEMMEVAAPPVRGDREALLKYLDIFLHPNPEVNLSGLVCKHGLAIEACAARECSSPMAYETAIKRARDYISSLPVQSAPDRDTLYAILSKHIPQDMIDGIWQEIQEASREGGR